MKKILLILLLLTSCATKVIKPIPTPSYGRLAAIKDEIRGENRDFEAASISEEISKQYLEALKYESLKDFKGACKNFRALSENENFPLHQVALIHTLANCSFTIKEIKKIWKNTSIPDYLKEAYYTHSIALAEKLKIDESIAEFSYELISFKQVQSEKVKLLKNAINIAQNLQDSKNESKYFKKLTEISPLHMKEISKENSYQVARDFEANRQFTLARDIYLDIINGEFTLEEKIKAYNAYRNSFKVARELKTFLEKTGEMELFLRQLLSENPQDEKLQEAWVDAKINYARAIWTEHMNEEARIILDDVLESNIGNSNQLATLYLTYGSLHLESKETEDALGKYEKAGQFKTTTLDLQENIQWAIVWNKYLLKKYSKMIDDVDRFTKKSSNPNFIHKLNFWKSRALIKLKRNNDGNELLNSIILNDPYGYYGLVSAMITKSSLKPLSPSTIINEPIGNFTLDWLIAMDEKNLSAKFLKSINSQFKTIAERERVMSLYAQTGWYQGGMLQIYNFPMTMRNDLTTKYISIVFPTPYDDLFEKFSKKYRLPKFLSYAITRQESAFNPNVRSWADAFGLMQMIPEKASELSKKYSIHYDTFNDLYNPGPNIEMGVALLSELKTLFSGKFAQTTAAYNASTKAIAVWEKERFNGDYLEFIEMIPYEETRNYIKLVFRNYMTYKRIFSSKEILIPEDFFTQDFN